jgi:4-hydroxybutyrate dehydrogenase / sulfolactaldehyde 3-reductase
MLDVMRTTMAWNNQLAIAMPRKGFVGDFSPGFMVKLARKDVRLAVGLVRSMGIQPDLGATALDVLERAVSEGLADNDNGAMLLMREREAGVQVRLANPPAKP